MDSRLLVIVPSRGRPQNVAALWEAFRDTTGPEASMIVAVDDDDPALEDYHSLPSHPPLCVGPRQRLGGTLNEYATEYADLFDAICFFGDDHRPRTSGWAVRFLAELDRLGTGMVYGNDLIQGENLPTAIAMTSDIITALGYMVPGGLVHLYVDNAWLALGQAIGCITYLPDVVIEHCHPIAQKAEWDAGYAEVNDPMQYESDGQRLNDWKQFQMPADVEKLQELIAAKECAR